MEKMDGKTMDIVAENVCKLKELFPETFTEGKVDFDALKEVLGIYVDDRDERYSFTWNGKSKARMIAQTPSTGTLRPCKEESVDWETTQNIFIEGDNLEVLKLLQKSYHKKVKMIYIDPPYNTGKDFVYKDNFKDNIKNYKEITGQVDGEGRNLSNNPETSGRYHTDWLNMMYPRLKLARNLLKDDGVIFISIDDNEASNLRKICDEIFGEENVENLIWNKEAEGSSGTLKQTSSTRRIHEYVICVFKSYSETQFNKVREALKGKENELQTANLAVNLENQKTNHPNYFTITNPSGEKFTRQWKWGKDHIDDLIKNNLIYWGRDGSKQPRLIIPTDDRRTTFLLSILNYGGTTVGRRDFEKLLGGEIEFSYPKPVILLKKLIETAANSNDVILDFFAGSASSAHAVMQLNAEDGGIRKFIMVQLPEACSKKSDAFKAGYKTIAEIGKERIRRAAKKIKEEKPAYDGDLGFKVFWLDSTNIKPWEVDFDMTERTLEDFISNIKTDRREEDVLYEILLKYGLDLTLPITEHAIAGQKVFDIGMGALIICLADAISLEVVEGIAKLKDELNPEIMRVVFKDSGFKDDVVKTNAVQILKQGGIVDVKSL